MFQGVRKAAQEIRSGGLVVFPTETVYGIGADAGNSSACLRIFSIKKRPLRNPLIVHAASLEMLQAFFPSLPDIAIRLFSIFPSGPLTVIVPHDDKTICREACSDLDTVALRIPSHSLARQLIRKSGCLIAAPSANRSGQPSASTYAMAKNVVRWHNIPVLNGGDCRIGIESTILDASSQFLRILRPGTLDIPTLEKKLGERIVDGRLPSGQFQNAPGTGYAHYRPRIPVYLFSDPYRVREKLLRDQERAGLIINKQMLSLFRDIRNTVLYVVRDVDHYAQILYKSFAQMEEKNCLYIFCFIPDDSNHAVCDRLLRASSEL